MKKLITTLLFVFLFMGLFAETGYNGKQWWSSKNSVKNNLIYFVQPEITEENEIMWEYMEAEKKNILGLQTYVYYHFSEGYLFSISYSIPKNKTKELKEKFKNKVKEINIAQDTQTYLLEKDAEYNSEIVWQLFNAVIMNDDEYLNRFYGKGGKLTIYDYNDDTRVYIFENKIGDQTFVFYTYHEQDY